MRNYMTQQLKWTEKELHEWMRHHIDEHPCFAALSDEEVAADPCVRVMNEATEEARKVERNGGRKFFSVHRRLPDEEVRSPPLIASSDAVKEIGGFEPTFESKTDDGYTQAYSASRSMRR